MWPAAYGIEALSVHVPRYFIDLRTLAREREIDPAKYVTGLGLRRMAVCAEDEDPVTMAADACAGLLGRYDVDPGSIGLLVVGTESGVDGSKPVAAYVHGLLGLPVACRTFDTQHACYSTTAALRMAIGWCATFGRGRKALVVATDVARYELGSPGEPTQGAGSVAMLVGDEPELLVFDTEPEAVFTKDVMDFWRPHYRSTALVDGPISVENYLAGLAFTYRGYTQRSALKLSDFDYLLYHVPFPKMAMRGHALLVQEESVGEADPHVLAASFERHALPALWANEELGNIYSGSLYLSLAGLLEGRGTEAAGARLGLYSYGSGSCAEFFSGRVPSNPEAWAGRIGIADGLAARREIDYAEYRRLHERKEVHGRSITATAPAEVRRAGPMGRAAFHGVMDDRRVYSLLEA